MLELGYIDETEYNEATANVDAGLKFKKGSVESSDGVYSYHTDALITDVTNDIAENMIFQAILRQIIFTWLA